MPHSSPCQPSQKNVLLYPASGGGPYIQQMDFNKEGATHPNGFYVTAVDLRSTFAKHIRETLVQRFSIPETDETVADNHYGHYIIYFNLNLSLPLNLSIARLLGINPKLPGPRPTWRGDVVVVRHTAWPGHVDGDIPARQWLDIDPSIQTTVDDAFRTWYQSKEWATKIADEKRWADEMKRLHNPDPNDHEAIEMRRRFEMLQLLQKTLGPNKLKHVDMPEQKDISNKQKATDEKRMDKTWGKLEKNQNKQAEREETYKCRSCSASKLDLKVCQRCKSVRYCGKKCQAADWKRHKRECVEAPIDKTRS